MHRANAETAEAPASETIIQLAPESFDRDQAFLRRVYQQLLSNTRLGTNPKRLLPPRLEEWAMEA
jgi:hypothetical protein